jgi:hypothetical protein
MGIKEALSSFLVIMVIICTMIYIAINFEYIRTFEKLQKATTFNFNIPQNLT